MRKLFVLVMAVFAFTVYSGLAPLTACAQGKQAKKDDGNKKEWTQKDREDRYKQQSQKIDREAEAKKERLRDNPPKRKLGNTDQGELKRREAAIDKEASDRKKKLKDHLDNPQAGPLQEIIHVSRLQINRQGRDLTPGPSFSPGIRKRPVHP